MNETPHANANLPQSDTTFNTTTYTAIEGTGTTAKASWIQLDNGCANHTSALQFIWRVPNTILESRSAGSFHVSILPDWIGTATSSEPFTILSNSALSADAATTTTTIAGSAATPPHHDAHRSTIFGTSSDDDAGSTLPGQSDTTSLRGGLLGVAIIVPLLVVIVLGTCGTCCWLRRRRGDRSNTGERFRFKKSTFSSTQGSTLLSNASRNDERGGAAAADDRRDRAMSLELARFDSPRPQAAHTRHRPR